MNIKTLEYIHKILSEEAENYTRLEMYCEKENARYKQKMHCGECTAEEYQQREEEAKQAAEWKHAALDALKDFEAQEW